MWEQGQEKDGTKSKYFLQRDGWTIAKMNLITCSKYALYHGTKNCGYYATADEAKSKYMELNK